MVFVHKVQAKWAYIVLCTLTTDSRVQISRPPGQTAWLARGRISHNVYVNYNQKINLQIDFSREQMKITKN